MLRLTGLFTILVLIIYSEAIPKRYHGIPLQLPKSTRADLVRLDHKVVPQNYKLDLTLTAAGIAAGTFAGHVEITLNFINETKTTFPIHARDIVITAVTLTKQGFDGTITSPPPQPDANDLVQLTSNKPIPIADGYLLTIDYTGILSDTDMDGFYKSTYLDANGALHYLATTQFEQMGARRAFPCFDEPDLKATFEVSITHPDIYKAISNTAVTGTVAGTGTSTTTFRKTPSMSTYLVAFIVSEFQCTDGPTTENSVPTNVCSRISTEGMMALALDTAPKVINEMNNYTDYDYKDMDVGKMTQAAIPDFAAGAMENWGMVTYREAAILWDPAESSNSYKQSIVLVIAHEFAHQWFGDLVTLNWWGNVFLNEGFATYFEYHAADHIDTAAEWELPKQFVVDELQTVLVSDSVTSSLPLSVDTDDADILDSRFDDISYNKGGTILRMVHHLLGITNFKTGLNSYLKKGTTGTPDVLWTALNENQPTDEPQKLPDTLPTVMDKWTHAAGYPCLTLTLAGNNITVTQARFLISGEDTDKTQWYVPITYTISNDTTNFASTATQAWLVPDQNLTLTLDGADWIVLNNQQVGYYRVNYDDDLLTRISTALSSANQGNIDEISRSQIVDDQLNFARAGVKDYGEVLRFLGFLKSETSYYTWNSVFSGYSYLLKRIGSSTVKEALNSFILEQMAAVLDDVSLTDTSTNQIKILKKVMANTWACKLGQEECVSYSKSAFANFTLGATANKVSPDLRSIVYCYGLRNSDDPQAAYNFLYNQYNTSNLATEKITILRSLGCVSDSAIRKEYLKKALTDEVRLQDARYVFSSVYSFGPEGIDDVLSFISENYTDFNAHFGSQSTLNSVIYSVADLFTTQAQITTLTTFAQTEGLDATIAAACQGAIANANTNLATIAKLEQSLTSYFELGTGSAEMNGYHLINLALILVVYLLFNV